MKKRQRNKKKKMASERYNPGHKNADPVQKETPPPYERNVHLPFPSSIEVRFPLSVEKNHNANQERQEARDIRRLWLERLMVLVVTVSMFISLYMSNEMRKTTEATKLSADAGVASTAAWIAVERLVLKSIEKDQVKVDVLFKNIGKTPALSAES